MCKLIKTASTQRLTFSKDILTENNFQKTLMDNIFGGFSADFVGSQQTEACPRRVYLKVEGRESRVNVESRE